MRISKYTPEQVAMALRQAESGTPAVEVCRKLHVTEEGFFGGVPEEVATQVYARIPDEFVGPIEAVVPRPS